jgi:hypothetical protein
MMVSRRIIAPIALATIALQLLLALPAERLVLCVGSDGHVAVESGGCREDSPAGVAGCAELGYPAPCSDTPLDTRELVSAKSPRAADAAAALTLAASPAAGLAQLARASLVSQAAALPAPSRTQRSAILRL